MKLELEPQPQQSITRSRYTAIARHEALLEWCETWPACDPDGNPVDANVTVRASVHDCINLQRQSARSAGQPMPGDDAEHLLDFMAIHSAFVVGMPEPRSKQPCGFYIMSHYDRPTETMLAEKRKDGTFYYVHPSMRDRKEYHGMTPESPTPVEDFGVRVDVKAGILAGAVDETAEVTAAYPDGRPWRWQGSRMFSFEM